MAQDERFLLEPMAGRLVVRTSRMEDEITASGLILPASKADRPTVGKVVAACAEYEQDGEDYEPLFKPGEVVVFGKWTGTEIEVGRDKFLLIRETDILARMVASDSPNAVPLTKVKISPRHAEEI
jgi:chaperonin GroES